MYSSFIESRIFSYVFSLLTIFIAGVITIITFQTIDGKKQQKTLNILFEDCDPELFISEMSKLLSCPEKMRSLVYLNLSAGYLATENYMPAIEMLQSVKFLNTENEHLQRPIYYCNLADFYMKVNDLPNASEALNSMKAALDHPKLPPPMYELYYNAYMLNRYSFNIKQGIYDGAEVFLNLMFEKIKQKQTKNDIKHMLGKIFLHFSRTDEAIRAFEYVVQHGNKLYIVTESKQYLSQLQGEIINETNPDL